jgi:hypothetical protein
LADLVNDGAIQVNFGNLPFNYPLPAGYAGFERPGSFMSKVPRQKIPYTINDKRPPSSSAKYEVRFRL